MSGFRVAIVGAGIGGLAAAHRLKALAEESGKEVEIVVLEASGRAGGVLGSERIGAGDTREGALLERGPDTLVTHKPAGIELCRRLGLGDQLVYLTPGSSEIVHRGRLMAVPEGFALLAPTRRGPLLRSPLLSWGGRLRAFAESWVSPAVGQGEGESDDESVASFVRRRFGNELLERIAAPIVGAIYMADVEQLSLAATFPRFRVLEREHGSVSRGLRKLTAMSAATSASAPATATLAGGLGQIADALVTSLPPGALRLNTRVGGLGRHDSTFEVRLTGAPALVADAVVLATPAPSASSLVKGFDATLGAAIAETAFASCATVHLGWSRSTVARPPRSHGLFLPTRNNLGEVVAVSYPHLKFPDRVPPAPMDQIVARVFLGGALRPDPTIRSDAELVEIAVRELTPLLGLSEPPLWSHAVRHPLSMPQPSVGHLDRVAKLRERLREHPGLELAGGPVGAYGVPDSIAAGESAAERVFAWLTRRESLTTPARHPERSEGSGS